MKRDMDLIRELLLRIEAVPAGAIAAWEMSGPELRVDGKALNEVRGHMDMLIDAGFVDQAAGYDYGYVVRGLTWQGHDFLDSVRDPEIWERTKKAAAGAGGFTVELLRDLAIGFLKTKIKEHTGIEL